MRTSNRRTYAHGPVLLIAALVHFTSAQAGARVRTPDEAACRAQAHQLLRRAALERRIYARTAGLLDTKHYPQALAALHRAIRLNDAWAGWALGGLYAAGLGVARNAHDAFHWYLWAARHGNRFAQREVANAYLNGVGTPENPGAAAYWFRRGMAVRQIALIDGALAKTYARGDLAPVNRAKARYYGRASLAELRALRSGPNAAAAYYLGIAYAKGYSVRPDRHKALAELCRAVALHYEPAASTVLHLEGSSP